MSAFNKDTFDVNICADNMCGYTDACCGKGQCGYGGTF